MLPEFQDISYRPGNIDWKYMDYDDNHPKVLSCIDLVGDAIQLHGSHVIIY